MNIQFRYTPHIDLLFHTFAYLKVNNASDCYSKEYIDDMAKIRHDTDYNIISAVDSLREYYNENFDRLGIINFLPFSGNSFDEMKNSFLTYNYFTAEDIEFFIKPFIKILDAESSFYFEYWNSIHEKYSDIRKSAESFIRENLEKYSCIFTHYNKDAYIIMSYAITRNGRGFNGIPQNFSALIPFPKSEDTFAFKSSFFTLLHEYTHQFTDNLMQIDINMGDGTHDISENIVIVTDYYLINSIDHDSICDYFKWLIPIDRQLDEKIKNLLRDFQIC